MPKVNSILNYIKSYQESIEGLRQNVPGFTFNGFTLTVVNDGDSQVITVFGIVNTELDEGAMNAITQTVPKLNQSITSVTTTDYRQIIKEPNAPIYYNQTIEITTTNEKVSELEVEGKHKGNGRDDFLIADDIPEMPVSYSFKSTDYTYSVITPEEEEKPVDEQPEGNNEVSGDEVVHDLTEKESKEILNNLLGKNEKSIDLNNVIGKLFKADMSLPDQPDTLNTTVTLKELMDNLLGNDGDEHEEAPEKDKKSEWDKVIVFVPEEHLTLVDSGDVDITFDTDVDTTNNTRETVITIKGVKDNLFKVGHKLTLTTQAGDLAGDITTGIIDDIETDDYGLHVWVSEKLGKSSPVKEETKGVNTDKELPIEDYAKGEPGVEGKQVSVKGVPTGSTKADHVVLRNAKITIGGITISADELVFDGKINIVEYSKED